MAAPGIGVMYGRQELIARLADAFDAAEARGRAEAIDLDPCKQCHPELHRSQCWPNARCVATEEN